MAHVTCIMGVSGSGKSTLAYKLAAHYKANFENCKVVTGIARSCKLGINSEFNADSALWIFNEHLNKTMEAIHEGYDYVICDRSCMDSLLYAKARDLVTDLTPQLLELSKKLMYTYDKIIYVQPDIEVVGDSVRPEKDDVYKKVYDEFEDFLKNYLQKHLPERLVILSSSEIFEKELPRGIARGQ